LPCRYLLGMPTRIERSILRSGADSNDWPAHTFGINGQPTITMIVLLRPLGLFIAQCKVAGVHFATASKGTSRCISSDGSHAGIFLHMAVAEYQDGGL
jgi:hypothetical protein